jgi:cysteinyl-tRNA synthetase
MAKTYLGDTFDIHCGGVDHIPIHHTNEIAQSEGANGKPFARFWVHGEFLLMNNAKMAKSAVGFIRLADLKEQGFDALDYRYHCFTAHYRKQLDFTWESLESSKTSRRRLCETAAALEGEPAKPACADHQKAFRQALEDDLNAPEAVAAVWDALKSGLPAGAKKAFLEQAVSVLALGLLRERTEAPLSAEQQELLERRAKARSAKDFKLADELRRKLGAMGIVVEDTKQGQKWRRK